MEVPSFLKSYYALLKHKSYGQSDDERLNFVMALATKAIEHRAILVNFDVELTDTQMVASGHPRNPVIVTPVTEKVLSFFTNRREVERIIAEADPIKYRSIFTRSDGKILVDQPSVVELLEIAALPIDCEEQVIKSINLKGNLITPNQMRRPAAKGFS